MSVPNQTPYNIYTANGLTTVFAYEFYLISASDIQVTINGNEVTSGYTVSGVGNTGGGEVTFLTAPANGSTVIFERVTPTYRLTDYQDNGDLLADTVNKDFDRLWMAIQRAFIYLGVALTRPLFGGGPFNANGYRIANVADPINDKDVATKKFVVDNGKTNLSRTLRVPESSIPILPAIEDRKNRLLAFNNDGNPFAVLPESGSAADVLIELAKPTGAGIPGFNPFFQYPDGTVGEYLAQVPLADNKGVSNSLSAFNTAIKKLSLAGGGVIKPEPGIYLISGGSVLWPTDVTLDLRGVTLTGDNENTLIKAGAIVNGELVDITTEYGTGNTGNGTHYVSGAAIVGGTLKNAALGVRGHRLNNNTYIAGVTFHKSLKQSWVTSHSWGLRVTGNTVWAPAIMKDFVDWTEISGNTFEGNDGWNDNYVALTITTGGYGGSYSMRLTGNGFHRMHIGVNLTCEMANCVMEDNHFEAVVKHVVGDNNDKRHFRIKNNWMKANLLTAQAGAAAVTPMTFGFLRDSEIGPNRFTRDSRSPDYDYYINAAGSNVFGNEVFVGYKTDSDFSRFNLNATNILRVIRGGNLASTAFPEIDLRSGNGAYTFEKYRSVYNYVNQQIPNCSVTYDGSVVTIKTWVPWSTTGKGGCVSFCTFHFNVLGKSRTIRLAGRFDWNVVSIDVNKEIFGNGDTLGMTLSGSDDGFTIVTITGAPSGGAINGWIKEL